MPEPGWYDDPEDAAQLRWWDGSRWTERRQPREASPPPPPAPPVTPPPSTPSYGIPLGEDATGQAWAQDPARDPVRDPVPGAVLTAAAPPRTFVEAVKVCLTKYVDGKGRASRSEFWYFGLFTFLADLLTGGIAVFFVLLPSITVQVRRLHDIGRSAWSLLWILVPFLGWAILIYYSVKPGEPHMNQYG